MQISVVVPVYNAARYVRAAVQSALAHSEVAEVILVEDASTDASLSVCEAAVADHYPRVRLLRHTDGRNHGAGASRNLGIRSGRFDHVAFLDADDFYLPDRFSTAKALFQNDPEVDGVYEAIGTHFETQSAERRWREMYGDTMLTTMTERVQPDRLFESMAPVGECGWWSLDGWTVKRALFEKTGPFDEHLRLHQDTAMCVKAAAVGRMMPGRLEMPVAMRRVHSHNRIMAERSASEQYRHRLAMWGTLWRWGKRHTSKRRQQLVLKRFLAHALAGPSESIPTTYWYGTSQRWVPLLGSLLLQYPDVILQAAFWKECVQRSAIARQRWGAWTVRRN